MKYKYFIVLALAISAAIIQYFFYSGREFYQQSEKNNYKKQTNVIKLSKKLNFSPVTAEVNLKIPQNFEKEHVNIPTHKNIFTENDYKKVVVYPFLKKWLTQERDYKNHPLYDAACRGLAGLLTVKQKKLVIENAAQILKSRPYDEISLLALYYSDKKHFSNYEWNRRLTESVKGKGYLYIRYELYRLCKFTDDKPNRIAGWLPLALYKNFAHKKLTPREAQYIFRLIMRRSCNAKWHIQQVKTLEKDNPYLADVLFGVFYKNLAWNYRGGGWADSVTEKGWKMFDKYLELSKQHLLKAYNKHKFMPEAAAGMITYCMAKDSDNMYLWANRALAAQVDYRPIYYKLETAMRPRWCGSLIDQIILADKCVQSGLYDTNVPKLGLDMYKNVVDDCHYRNWEKIYNRPEIIDNMEQILNGIEQNDIKIKNIYGEDAPSHDYYQALLASYYFYAKKYKKAKAIIDRIGLKKMRTLEDKLINQERYYNNFYRVSQRINLYTGRFAKEYIAAEKEYGLGEDGKAIYRMYKLLQSKNLTQEERAFTVSMWGYYILGAEPKEYRNFRTPLIVAAVTDRLDIAKKLLELGVDINEKNYFGRNALYYVVFEDHSLKWIKFLVENGANINTKCNNGYSILYNLAAEQNKIKEIKYALAHGADPNIKNRRGFVSVHNAVAAGNLSNLKLLIEGGANVKAVSNKGYNALFSCQPEDNGLKIAKFLVDKGLNVHDINKEMNCNVLYFLAMKEEASELLRFFIKKGVDPNVESKYGFTPLMKAIDYNEIENVKALVEGGADVNAISTVNIEGSIQNHAKMRRNPNITNYLIENGMK